MRSNRPAASRRTIVAPTKAPIRRVLGLGGAAGGEGVLILGLGCVAAFGCGVGETIAGGGDVVGGLVETAEVVVGFRMLFCS